MTTPATLTAVPSVFIHCENCYAAGRLAGRWFGLDEIDEVTLATVHEGAGRVWPGCEEILVTDTSDMPLAREMSLAAAARWGECYEEAGTDRWHAVCAWVQSGCYTAEGTGDIPSLSDFEESYQGRWDSFREYAQQLADDIGLTDGWPDEAQRYFDWDAWTRDLAFDYTVADAPDGGIYVFRNL